MQIAQNLTQQDFGFPRLARSGDSELDALYAMLVSLGATLPCSDPLLTARMDGAIGVKGGSTLPYERRVETKPHLAGVFCAPF